MTTALSARRGPIRCTWAVALLLGAATAWGQGKDDKKNEPAPVGESYLKSHPVPAGLASDLARLVQKIYPPSGSVRISESGTDEVVIYGPTAVHEALDRLAQSARPGRPLQPAPEKQDVRPRLTVAPVRDGKQGEANKPITITAFGNRLILSCDDPDALALAQQLIRLLTQTPEGAGDFEVIRLKNASADAAAKVLDETFNGPRQTTNPQQQGGFFGRFRPPEPQTPKKADKVRVVAEPQSNSLLVWASPLDLLTIRRLLEQSIDSGETDSVAISKTWTLGPLHYASASDVSSVLHDVYREQMNENPKASQETTGGFGRFRRGGGFQNRNVDAAGNARKVSLSMSVDDRTNSLVLNCPESLYKDIQKLVADMEKAAQKSRRTIKVVSVPGVDPALLQQVIDAVQGKTTRVRTTGLQGQGFGPGMGQGPGGPGGGRGGGGFPGIFPGGGAQGGRGR